MSDKEKCDAGESICEATKDIRNTVLDLKHCIGAETSLLMSKYKNISLAVGKVTIEIMIQELQSLRDDLLNGVKNGKT